MSPEVTSPRTGIAVRPKRHGRGRQPIAAKIVFLIPATILFAAVMLVPVAVNAGYAFTDWDGFASTYNFVGLDNFVRIFGDDVTWNAMKNTLFFTAVNAPFQVGIGLVLALALQRSGRFITFLRVVIVMPIAISGVVLGFLGTIIFAPSTGILKTLSQLPFLEGLGQNWLGDPELAMSAVIAMNLWQWGGFTMLIFLAGLATIPGEYYEAATLDGAGSWGKFRHVTWPLLAPAATINIVLTLIGGLKIFDIIYVLTGGGPANSTQSIVMRLTSQSASGSYGYTAATSVSLTILITVIALIAVLILRRREIAA